MRIIIEAIEAIWSMTVITFILFAPIPIAILAFPSPVIIEQVAAVDNWTELNPMWLEDALTVADEEPVQEEPVEMPEPPAASPPASAARSVRTPSRKTVAKGSSSGSRTGSRSSGRTKAKVVRRKRKRRKPLPCVDPTPGIRKTGSNRYEVPRKLLDYYVGHIPELQKLGRVYRHRDSDGDPDGIRVRGVRCGNPVHQSGIRNGDIVKSVNGKPINNMMQALGAYLAVAVRKNVSVTVERGGQSKTLHYRLVR